jgi:phosphoglycerol transferase MdoB-like AlkP superfamily enzyme
MNILKYLNYYRLPLSLVGLTFLFLQLARIVSVALMSETEMEKMDLLPVFFVGFFSDLKVALPIGLFIAIPLLFDNAGKNHQRIKIMVRDISLISSVLFFVAAAQTMYFNLFGLMPTKKALAILLIDPGPILRNIWVSFPVMTVIILTLILFYVIYKVVQKVAKTPFDGHTLSYRVKGYALFVLMFVSVTAASSVYNANDIESTSGQFLSQNLYLTLNDSVTSFKEDYYVPAETDVNKQVAQYLGSTYTPDNPLKSITRQIQNTKKDPLNVVFILVEAFNANDEGRVPYSDEIVAPFMASLTKESLYFDQVYATSQATSRGVESATFAIPPGDNFMFLIKNSERMSSLPGVLKANGYKNMFFYGGDISFQNRDKLLRNPKYFDLSIDMHGHTEEAQKNKGIWGVHDHYVFDEGLEQINKHYQNEPEQPFYSLFLTLSTHVPYDIPYNPNQFTPGKQYKDVEQALRYTDQAIEKFISKAKKQPWFDNTLFVVMADHGHYASLNPTFNLQYYNIPLVIYAPKHIKPQTNSIQASQIDAVPTVLGLLGMSYQSTFFGADLLNNPERDNIQFMQRFEEKGALVGDYVVQFRAQKRVNMWQRTDLYDYKTIQPKKEIVDKVASVYTFLSDLKIYLEQ